MKNDTATPSGSLVGSWLKALLWRFITYLSGGLTVTGTVPQGPGIVVANHTSHGDTAVMFATLPARARPFAVAAADYWLSKWYKALAVKTLVSVVAVKRGGGDAYEDLLETVRPRVEAGGLVVIFPEGTRTTDGEVGEFKSGALRLAKDLSVPVYPAAILGIGQVLPKHGKWKRAPMEVAFGDPVRVPANASREEMRVGCAGLRDAVVGLKRNDQPVPYASKRFLKTEKKALTWWLWAVALSWGFIEAISWPLIAEGFIVFVAIVVPRRVIAASALVALGSAVGVVFHAFLAYHGVSPPMPLTTGKMSVTASEHLEEGYSGLQRQLFQGIPVKVYAQVLGEEAAAEGSPPSWARLFAATLFWRGLRIVGVGLIVAVAGKLLLPLLRRHYTPLFYGGFAVFLLLLFRVYSSWR